VPLPQKSFLDLTVKMAYFRELCAKFRFFYFDHNSIEYSSNTKTAMEIDLHAIKNVIQWRLSS